MFTFHHLPRNLMLVIILFATLKCCAQDTIILKSEKTGEISKREGEIKRWKGQTIVFDNGSRERTLDARRVIQVSTSWPKGYQIGLQFMEKREFAAAFAQFSVAQKTESRDWVQQEISAAIIQCLRATDQHEKAIELFIPLVANDPETRFFHLMPLQWVPRQQGRPSDEKVSQWIKSKNSSMRLIGASWRKNSQRSAAIDVLQSLLSDENANIAHYASAQMWNPLTAAENDIRRWNRQISNMPESLRGGPWFLIAEAQARNKLHDKAATNFMRIPIQFESNRSLVPPALYRTGQVLQNAGNKTEAQRVWNELKRDYPTSDWTTRLVGSGN